MKILWLIPGDPNSKVNMVFAKQTLTSLKNLGFDIRIFHLTSRSNPVAMFKLWKQAKKMIAEFQPELVHGQYGSIAGFFTCLLGLPTIITFRGSDINGDPELPKYRQYISWITSQLAAALSDVSIFVSVQLKNKLIFPGKKTLCMPSPIDLGRFAPLSKITCRSELKLPLNEKVVSFVSSGGRQLKRPDLAKEVCVELSRRGHKVRFLEIKGIDPVDVPKWLCSSDCMLFTSLREGSPNAVREALACGVPTVSVSVGDVDRWISQDPHSMISNTDSVNELASAVEKVWNLPEPRLRRVDFTEITIEAHVSTLASLYKSLKG